MTFVSDAMADLDPADHDHAVRAIFPRLGEVGNATTVEGLLPALALA